MAAQPANYDTDRDTDPGLWIRKGANGLDTTDPKRVQVWSVVETAGRVVSGSVQLRLWAATRDFNPLKSGEVVAALERCNPSGCTRIATDQLVFDGGNDWVELVFDFGTVADSWAAGDEIVVRVAVPTTSGDHPWIAYDSLATPARLVIAG